MKTCFRLLNAALCSSALFFVAGPDVANAAAFLSVDFESANGAFPAEGDTETGFQPFTQHNAAGRTYSTSEGNIFVNVLGEQPAGDDGYFERGPIADNGPFTFGDLYRDFAFDNDDKQMDFILTGLGANTAYSVTWFSYDNGGSHSVSLRESPEAAEPLDLSTTPAEWSRPTTMIPTMPSPRRSRLEKPRQKNRERHHTRGDEPPHQPDRIARRLRRADGLLGPLQRGPVPKFLLLPCRERQLARDAIHRQRGRAEDGTGFGMVVRPALPGSPHRDAVDENDFRTNKEPSHHGREP